MRKKMIHNLSRINIILLLLSSLLISSLKITFCNGHFQNNNNDNHHHRSHHYYHQSSFGAINPQHQHQTVSTSPEYSYSLITPNDENDVDVDDVTEERSKTISEDFSPEETTEHYIIVQPSIEPIYSSSSPPSSKQKRSQPRSSSSSSSSSSSTITNANESPNFPSIENLLADKNFTTFLEQSGNGGGSSSSVEYLQSNSPMLYNYFLPSSTSSGSSLYPVDLNTILPPQSNQYYGNYMYNQQQFNRNNKNKTTSSLGRRIGELVSNSAERATRAFKSFPKLLNDIKPSKLLGLTTTEPDLNIKPNISSIPLPSSWYLPQNTWSSFAPPPITSSVYLQQPVFVRTQDSPVPMHSTPIQTTNQILSPGTSASASASAVAPPPIVKSTIEYSSNANGGAGPSSRFVHHPNPPQNVYHHNSANDLYTSAQTVYGSRVKPPGQYGEYDGPNSDDISSSDQEDTKMANEGQMDSSGDSDGRINGNINGPNSDNSAGGDSSGWQPSSSPYEDYNDSPTTDYYPQSNFNPSSSIRFPKNPPTIRRPSYVPTSNNYANRQRPFTMADMEEFEHWYPGFYGPGVRHYSRLRNVPFNPSPLSSFANSNAILTPAASTPAAVTTETYIQPPYLPVIRPPEPTMASSFYPIAAAPVGPRPTWPFGTFYPNFPSTNQFFNQYRPNPMSMAQSMVRPITIPFFPPVNNFYMQRYRSLPYVGAYGYGTTAAAASMLNPAVINANPTAAAYPHRYSPQSPFNSLITAASSLYPVRVPFPPITSPLSYNTIIPAPITHIPILRHRIGSLASNIRNPIGSKVWKRNENSVAKRVDKAIVGSTLGIKSEQAMKHLQQVVSNHSNIETINNNKQLAEDNQLATLYNGYLFQKASNNNENNNNNNANNVVVGQTDHYYLNQPSEYHYFIPVNSTDENSSSSPAVSPSVMMVDPTILPTNDFVENLISSSSSSSSSSSQSSPSSSSSSPHKMTLTTSGTNQNNQTSSNPSSFRLMRAHRHIDKQREQEQHEPLPTVPSSFFMVDTTGPTTKQQTEQQKPNQISISPPRPTTNEWRPIFRRPMIKKKRSLANDPHHLE